MKGVRGQKIPKYCRSHLYMAPKLFDWQIDFKLKICFLKLNCVDWKNSSLKWHFTELFTNLHFLRSLGHTSMSHQELKRNFSSRFCSDIYSNRKENHYYAILKWYENPICFFKSWSFSCEFGIIHDFWIGGLEGGIPDDRFTPQVSIFVYQIISHG